jgi:hypothetical protein
LNLTVLIFFILGQDRKVYQRKTKIEVPKEEFDFESSNLKFERQEPSEKMQARGYTKASFFDDISTDLKDRGMNEK